MNWLRIENLDANANNGGRSADVWIDGEIGYYDWWDETGVVANQFIKTIDALGELDKINLMINSPGGVVSDGITIANYLRNHKASVSVTVMGQAASIASVVAMSADKGKLHMALGSTMMIHDPATIAIGNADDMRHVAEMLDKVRDSIVAFYMSRVDISEEEIKRMMQNETFMTAEEAVSMGFADTMDAELKAVASYDFKKALKKQKKRFSNRFKSKQKTGGRDTMKIDVSEITASYLSENHAEIVAELGKKAQTAGIEAERARIKAILSTPLANAHNDIVMGAIEKGETVEQVALAILAKEQEARNQALDNMRKDAAPIVDPVADNDDDHIHASADLDEALKERWDKNINKVQDDFVSFDVFKAYMKAEARGNVRILGKK